MEKREAESQQAFGRAIHELSVQIVRFEDGSFPGWVKCELLDAEGHRHELIDKVPIFTVDCLDANSRYPVAGLVQCEILDQWLDERDRELTRVKTIESTEGLSEFVVLSECIHHSE